MTNHQLDRKVKSCMSQIKTVIFEDKTIEEAIESLREKHISEKVLYFYVIDQLHHLKGLVATRDLLLKDPKTPIASILKTNVICLTEDQTVQEAMQLMENNRLLALPVVDSEKRLIGGIDVGLYIEESVDVANSKKTTQVFQMLGMILEEGKHFSIWKNYAIRMPWIFCNMFGGVACAIISHAYQLVMEKALILAMFIPLVLSLSESISMQAMTQTLNQKITKLTFGFMFQQIKLYALLALTCSLVVGSVSILWGDGLAPAFVIGSGILISIILSATVGVTVPYLLGRGRLDPKVASGPVVLMCADVLTTVIYFAIAKYILL